MMTMDVVQIFNDELQSLLDTKPPVSKAKMGQITRAAMKGVKFYKHIVQSVEKFIAKSRPEYKIPGLYVIDSIVRQSRHQFGVERDVYAARFSRNLQVTFNNLFSGCSVDYKPKIVRVLNLWQKNGVFNSQVIQPLLDMANPNSALTLPSESTLSADSPGNPNSDSNKHGQTSKYLMHHFSNSSNNSQYAKNSSTTGKHHRSDGSLRFSKNMLGFDYDEDDDDEGDETPTEAEPPLSSTLNKIEMEQRVRTDIPVPGHQSSQLHQKHHQQTNISHQPNMTRNDQDPVLERWNRLIKQQSITNENSNEHVNADAVAPRQRSRSRSPIDHEKYIISKEQPQSKDRAKSPVQVSAEKEQERKAERIRKCFPDIRDKHLTVCSSTLWLGHVPKTVSEADISDAFGEFGAITSIDLIPPRGCAYVCMDRRQDAKRALTESRDLKLNGSHIKMAWAPGKGFKEYKKLKDFWEVNIGASYIPYGRIDSSIDFDVLEEGGVIDEDSMSMQMREMREMKAKEKEDKSKGIQAGLNLPMPTLPILAQPPPPFTLPPPNLSIPPPNTLAPASGLGGIPFPPPNVGPSNSSMKSNLYDNPESQERDTEAINSPTNLDHQLSMTERQISMVEQQLNMIQQAQTIGQSQPTMAPMHPQMFHQNQPNPMLFDMPQLLHPGPQMIDRHLQQQIPIFANPPPLLGQPPIIPISQPGVNPNINGDNMSHYVGRYG